MLRKIKLYGQLAEFVGHKVLEADVATAAEAVRFLVANWPELESHMAKQYYRVHTGGDDLTVDDLHSPASREIKIVPVITGAGGDVGRIILGITLVAFSLLLPGIGAAIGGAAMTQIGLIGAGLALTGIAGLLTPTPVIAKDENDPRKSFSFSGIQNTSRVGTPVPIVYGEVLVGSVVVSAAIDTVQVSS